MASKEDMSQDIKLEVWKKAKEVAGIDSMVFRQDYAGAWIRFDDYGNRDSQYGWEIDHLKPLSLGGQDIPENRYPLQWRNNLLKGDNYPRWSTAVTADGQKNIEFVKLWRFIE